MEGGSSPIRTIERTEEGIACEYTDSPGPKVVVTNKSGFYFSRDENHQEEKWESGSTFEMI